MPGRITGRDGKANPGKFPTGTVANPPGKLQSRRVDEHAAGGVVDSWAQHLSQLQLPASRDELVEQAKAHGADDEVIQALQHMPESHYASLDDLRQGLNRGG
jgi:hypothetical protein